MSCHFCLQSTSSGKPWLTPHSLRPCFPAKSSPGSPSLPGVQRRVHQLATLPCMAGCLSRLLSRDHTLVLLYPGLGAVTANPGTPMVGRSPLMASSVLDCPTCSFPLQMSPLVRHSLIVRKYMLPFEIHFLLSLKFQLCGLLKMLTLLLSVSCSPTTAERYMRKKKTLVWFSKRNGNSRVEGDQPAQLRDSSGVLWPPG